MSQSPPAYDNPITRRVHDEICEMLRTGELAPGERLKEVDLTQRLQISRSTAREALRMLEYGGLVRIIPNKGAEIRKLSMKEALNLYDLRAGLARAAGRAAALRSDRDQLRRLQELQDELAGVLETGEALRYNQINISFHSLIFEAARNPRLRAMNAVVDDELSLFLSNTHYTPQAFERSWQEHQKIADAIRGRDPVAAANAFEEHILQGKQRLVDGQVTVRF
jgi:DNA-binding GntR family transcriptional regulator